MILRKAYFQIQKELESKHILLLLGPRQVGKTTVLKQLQQTLDKENKDTFFLNLEDFEIKNLLDTNPKNIFDIIGNIENQKKYVFIDEIQYLKNPSNFLKLLFDDYHTNLKLIVSGSSSFYIDQKFKDSLIGRKKVFHMYGLDFFEFLTFKGKEKLSESIKKHQKKPFLDKKIIDVLFTEYVTYGGYPEVVLLQDNQNKINRLKEYSLDYIKKDIFDANIQDETKFFNLIKILANQTGNLVNMQELASTLGLSGPTIEKYIYVMQKSFQISLISSYHHRIRKEITKMKKVYFYDLGMRNVLLNNFEVIENRHDKGEFFENIVFKEFLNKIGNMGTIKYRRTQDGSNEVDFIINDQKAYEVKFNKSAYKESKYKKFKNLYPDLGLDIIDYENIFDEIII